VPELMSTLINASLLAHASLLVKQDITLI
jgi:hypothetical protein